MALKVAKITIFNTPIITDLLRLVAWVMLKLSGWKKIGQAPDLDKYVLIGGPHTSNWDFVVMIPMVLLLRIRPYWLGKHTLFPWPLGWLMRWLGGVAVDRRSNHNLVEQAAQAFAQENELVLLITPEGTRGEVERWKTGFYHIAQLAQVPVVHGFLDYPNKEAGIDSVCHTTGDIEYDLPRLQAQYYTKQGLYKRRPPGSIE